MARSELEWNVGDPNMACLRGYLDLLDGDFDKTVARLKALGAEDEGPGDHTTVEFRGRFNGAVFTLYDYCESRSSLNIGGHAPYDGPPVLDVEGLKAHLARWFALPEVLARPGART
jgi:hypothetical protein